MANVTPSGVGAVVPAPANTQTTGQKGTVPFRYATTRRTARSIVDGFVMAAVAQPDVQVLNGTGYLEFVDIDCSVVCAGNAAAVTYGPDDIWGILSNITLQADGPQLFNLSGYGLHLLNLYGGFGLPLFEQSLDPLVYYRSTAIGDGGSFRAKYRLPLAINARSLIGIQGNQDRATRFELHTDVNPSATVYGVLPTAPGNLTITRQLGYCTLPYSQNANNMAQQTQPPYFGVIHYANQVRNQTAPVTASPIDHFFTGLGNTDRVIILLFTDALGNHTDAMIPTTLNWRIGPDVYYDESGDERRAIMADRYAFDAPPGVLVYDFLKDFVQRAGYEVGADWLNTKALTEMQVTCNYPAFANSPGRLDVITDSLSIPAGMPLQQYT